MRFAIQREAFLKPLRVVAGVVERKHTQTSPVLLNVLIKVDGKKLCLTATDQEVELVSEGRLEESAAENGAITVPVRKLMDICKTLSDGQSLSVIEEQDRITVRAGRSRFTLSTLPASEFPNSNDQVGNFQFTLSKKNLKSLLEQTCFAMAEQDVRYYLNGMLLEVRDNKLYGVAADGHRLAFGFVPLQLNVNVNVTETVRVIVPRKGVLELQRILDDSEEEVRIVFGENHIRVITQDVQLTSKLLDGRFPDYQRLVSTDGDKVFVGRREALKESFQRAATLFSDRFKGVRLRLTHNCLKILATNAEQDEVEEDVEVEYSGDELEIGFNIRYLIDFLTVIQTEMVKFTFSDATSSARVEGVGAASGVYVIMPMRI